MQNQRNLNMNHKEDEKQQSSSQYHHHQQQQQQQNYLNYTVNQTHLTNMPQVMPQHLNNYQYPPPPNCFPANSQTDHYYNQFNSPQLLPNQFQNNIQQLSSQPPQSYFSQNV
jgi:hypothetical protein